MGTIILIWHHVILLRVYMTHYYIIIQPYWNNMILRFSLAYSYKEYIKFIDRWASEWMIEGVYSVEWWRLSQALMIGDIHRYKHPVVIYTLVPVRCHIGIPLKDFPLAILEMNGLNCIIIGEWMSMIECLSEWVMDIRNQPWRLSQGLGESLIE